MFKIEVAEINKGEFTCKCCGNVIKGTAVIHTRIKGITCEGCVEKDVRSLVDCYDCRIESFLSNHAQNAIPDSEMICRKRNFQRSMLANNGITGEYTSVNAYTSNARAILFPNFRTLSLLDKLTLCATIA